jgi:uncharacterized delta-60 repeat protein
MRKILSRVIAGFSGIGLMFSLSFAQAQGPGSLDTSFGTGGIVTTGSTGVAPLYAIQQSTGDIVAFGAGPTLNSIGLLRYTPSGQLDTTFGANGVTITSINSYAFTEVGMAVQPNNDVIVLNAVITLTGENVIVLVRYTPDGALDTTFGNAGIVQTSGLGASALLLQPNGQIVVGGGGFAARGGTLPTTLVRYNSDGTLDTSFGTRGVTQAPVGTPQPAALALLSNGDYLSVQLEISGDQTKSSVQEFNPAGVPQSQVTRAKATAISANFNTAALALFQSNGRYIVATSVSEKGQSLTLEVEAARFTETGKVDPTFSSTPFSFGTAGNESFPYAAAFQSNGQLVLGGRLLNSQSGVVDYALARLDSNGKLDPAFGVGGTVTGSLSGDASVTGLLIQKDGNIVAVLSGAIARFLAN